MIITPNLHFHGQCQEAIALYQRAFGCTIGCLLHYSDADPRDWDVALTEQEKDYVYHAEIYIGGQRVMMGDERDGACVPIQDVFLTVTFDTAQQVRDAFEALRDGGTVLHPLRSTTYSSCMGTLLDKFGRRWGLMTEQTER